MPRFMALLLLGFVILFILPLGAHAALYWSRGWDDDWRSADWGSTGILPAAAASPEAMVRIYSAPTGRWRGIFAVHTWVVVKRAGAARYERYDVVGWGRPVRHNAYAPDARWFGHTPQVVAAADGGAAARMIPAIDAAIAAYPYAAAGDYRVWPGPNSNSFVASVIAAVPELGASMPPNAVGRDFPVDGRWFGTTASGTGWRLSLGGYGGVTVAWVEGIELNVLGMVAGLDIRRPALKLPGFGRIGVDVTPAAAPAA